MPLTTPDRSVVVKALHLLRPDWDLAGIDAQLRRHVCDRPEPVWVLLLACIDVARDPRHLTPASLRFATTEAAERPASRTQVGACTTHGGTTSRHTDNGPIHTCCQQARHIPDDQPCHECAERLTHRAVTEVP